MSRYIDFYLIGELVDSHGNVHYEDLKNLPTADVPQWIPCSERLPKAWGTYMTTIDYGEFGIATGQRYFYNKEMGWDDDGVVAWMPLPNPWRGEVDERLDNES